MSRIASRLAATVLAAGALVTAAALPASAADHARGHDRGRQQSAQVVLGAVHHTANDRDRSNRSLNNEWITVTNEGRRAVSLNRWTLTDAERHTYRFGNVTLRAHESLRVHTGNGRNTARDLYQDRGTSVWNRSRDTATLRDARGAIVDTESWGHRTHR